MSSRAVYEMNTLPANGSKGRKRRDLPQDVAMCCDQVRLFQKIFEGQGIEGIQRREAWENLKESIDHLMAELAISFQRKRRRSRCR